MKSFVYNETKVPFWRVNKGNKVQIYHYVYLLLFIIITMCYYGMKKISTGILQM